MASKTKLENQWEFAISILGALLIGAIILTPVDQGKVHHNSQNMGEWAQWYTADNNRIHSNMSQTGGMLPYYLNRVHENRAWQNEYRAGLTKLNHEQWKDMHQELENRWEDWQARR